MAINFNGSTQRLSLSNPPDSNGVSDITCCFWIFLTSTPAEYIGIALDLSTNTNSNPRCRFAITNTQLLHTEVRIDDGNPVRSANSTGTISTGVWHHAAIHIDAPGELNNFYIDGSFDSSVAVAYGNGGFPASNSQNGAVGAAVGTGLFLPARLADLRVYNRALSAKEIRAIYVLKGHDFIRNGLIRRMTLNEFAPGATANTTIYDETQISGNATSINSPEGSESILSYTG